MNPAKQIETFVDELSNWYIRRSRDRFWGSEMTDDKVSAYQTLRDVLLTLARMIAPYAPLIADDLYDNSGARKCSSGGLSDDESILPSIYRLKMIWKP